MSQRLKVKKKKNKTAKGLKVKKKSSMNNLQRANGKKVVAVKKKKR